MWSMAVISTVDNHSPWCTGMVVVPKLSEDMKICVDLKPLNYNVLRVFHPLTNVHETLAQLARATKLSKLNANSGFLQLTTFITPFGQFQFNKLPFGISCAPKLFQKHMSRMLSGLQARSPLFDG